MRSKNNTTTHKLQNFQSLNKQNTKIQKKYKKKLFTTCYIYIQRSLSKSVICYYSSGVPQFKLSQISLSTRKEKRKILKNFWKIFEKISKKSPLFTPPKNRPKKSLSPKTKTHPQLQSHPSLGCARAPSPS